MGDTITEIWLPIEGYEGLYEISNYGNVANLNYRHTGKRAVLKLTSKDRYIKVALVDANGKSRTHWVHRLVGLAFLPPPQEGQVQINHINGDKQDNHVWNLEWNTPKQNCNNPNTPHKGYHLSEEVRKRMGAAQRKRMREHPEDLRKMWDGYKRWRNGYLRG